MINVSSEFKKEMQHNTLFLENAELLLLDGTALQLGSNDFTMSNNSVFETSGSDSLPIGEAIARQIQIELDNHDDRYSSFDFVGATIRLYLTYVLSNGIEDIDLGTYTVVSPETYGKTVIISAIDDMYKADANYTTTLSFPQTAAAVLRDACDSCGILLKTSNFLNNDFVINQRPSSDYTFRQVIGWIAMIAVGNARINRHGYLEILSYQPIDLSQKVYDGGLFSPWTIGDVLDGGLFSPWTDADSVDEKYFQDLNKIHVLYNFSNLKIDTDDIQITGVSIEVEEDYTTILYGDKGYVLHLKNPIVSGNESELLAVIGPILTELKFRKFEGDHIAYPLAEFMDTAIICDRNGNAYQTIITDVDFTFFGHTTLKNCAKSTVRNSSTFNSSFVKTVVETKKLIQKEQTARENAIKKLDKTVKNAKGMYSTEEQLEDGSTINYLHDKPTLRESVNVLKITADAIGLSTDGGKTFPYGVTLDGDAITKILYTEGVNADWINTGALVIKDKDGNVIFSADMDTKSVFISGENVRIGGKTLNTAIFNAVTEAKDYSDSKLADYADAVTKDVANLQAQIDGQIESYYEDYEPSLQNYPASEWTTTEERKKHIGDLFYWKSTGYAYRFLLDASTWKWQMVQDTDITKALAEAEKALDTADGKRRTFVTTPAPPYDIGDIWMQGDNGDILTCVVSRGKGSSFVLSDWTKMNKYTDDTVADQALQQTDEIKKEQNLLNDDFIHVGTLVSGQSDPDGGTNAVKLVATGSDCYYSANSRTNKPIKSTGQLYTFSVWLKASKTTNIIISLNHTNGIRQEVTLTTSWKRFSISAKIDSITSYNHVTVGGWGSFSTSNGADIYIYKPTVNYVNLVPVEVLTQEDIFNLLTNNGEVKGIYKDGNQLYISFTYARGGELALGGTNNGNGRLKILDSNNKEVGYIDNTGVHFNTGSFTGTVKSEIGEIGGWNITKNSINSVNELIKLISSGAIILKGDGYIKIGLTELSNFSNALKVDGGLWVYNGTNQFSDGTDQMKLFNLPHVQSGGQLVFGSDGETVSYLSSSSKRYKDIKRLLIDDDIEKAFDVDVVLAKYKEDYGIDKRDPFYGEYMPMFLAEDIEQKIPSAAVYKNGKIEDWNYRVMIPVMFQMLKSQKNQIVSLTKEINILKRSL